MTDHEGDDDRDRNETTDDRDANETSDDRDRNETTDDRDGNERTDDRADRPGVVDLSLNVGLQSISDLLGGVLDSAASGRRGRPGGPHATDPHDSPPWHGGRDAEVADEPTGDYLVATHRTDDEYVVTAELPGADEADVDVSIDLRRNDLVIAVDGRPVDRVALPWPTTEAAKVWFNNGILEVRLVPGPSAADDS